MKVQQGAPEDFCSWLDLAREVEHLFGPMVAEPPFRQGLEEALASGLARCVRFDDGPPGAEVLGGIVICTETNRIEWLAVRSQKRGRGLGRALLNAALDMLEPGNDVRVQTFAGGLDDGAPARKLYRELGFCDEHPAEPTPTGVATVVMVRPSSMR